MRWGFRPFRSALFVGSAMVTLVHGVAPAFGQDAPTTSESAQRVEDIVVTASRRSEKLHDVPVSETVLQSTALTAIQSGGQDLTALASKVPSLNVETSEGRIFPRFYIRGYGNADFSAFASQPVSLILDDIVQESPYIKGFPIFDARNVEVLRGPQGTLFGRNTPAGIVSIHSVAPTLEKFEGYAKFSDGTYNTLQTEGAVNIPLSNIAALRVSGIYQHRDDWVSDPIRNDKLEGYDDAAARVQLLVQPSDDFTALFNVHGHYLNGNSRLFRANIIAPGTNHLVSSFDTDVSYTDQAQPQSAKIFGAGLHLTWKLGSYTLSSITGYERVIKYKTDSDLDGGYGAEYAPPYGPGPIPYAVYGSGNFSGDQFSQELRLASDPARPLNYQVGAYYFTDSGLAHAVDLDGVTAEFLDSIDTRQTTQAIAVFGSVQYRFSPKFNVRGGIRYTHDEKQVSITDTVNYDVPGPQSLKASTGRANWDFSATYLPTSNVTAYARVATGYRAPSFGAASAYNPLQSAKAETLTSYEAGIKTFFFDRMVSFDLTAYHYIVRNQQLTAVGGTGDASILLNAKKTLGSGLEAEFNLHPTRRVTLSASGSLNNTKLRDKDLTVQTCLACTVTDPTTSDGRAYVDGNPLPQAAKYIADVALDYTIPLTASSAIHFYSDLSYRSKVDFFLYQSKEFTGPSLTNLGLRAAYEFGNGKYEAAVYCRNCANQIRAVYGIDFVNLAGAINEPRLVAAQISAKF